MREMNSEHSNVLVVEDDPELNELVGAYVEIAGFTYRPAHNASEAMRQVRNRLPDLIVLDVMLPDRDGFEICRELKSQEQTRKIPILMLTALDREEYRQKGCQCGAAEYMTKPFDPDRLMQAIQDHVSKQ
jgi:DNA-binding response OmpR family regulator